MLVLFTDELSERERQQALLRKPVAGDAGAASPHERRSRTGRNGRKFDAHRAGIYDRSSLSCLFLQGVGQRAKVSTSVPAVARQFHLPAGTDDPAKRSIAL